jgi:D-glycero-D-manno-heptose 1,7-bisphosphate phosphatase
MAQYVEGSEVATRSARLRLETVILDRDGVINENRPDHVKSWDEFRFLAGAREAIAQLCVAGVRVFVVTNQAIVNRGLVSTEEANAINRAMIDEVERGGGRIEAVVYCPHRPDEGCACRKPRPGLLHRLADEYGVELRDAVVIGDALADIQAGQAAGCTRILVLTGRGQDQLIQARAAGIDDFLVADSLFAAVTMLLELRDLRRPVGVT